MSKRLTGASCLNPVFIIESHPLLRLSSTAASQTPCNSPLLRRFGVDISRLTTFVVGLNKTNYLLLS